MTRPPRGRPPSTAEDDATLKEGGEPSLRLGLEGQSDPAKRLKHNKQTPPRYSPTLRAPMPRIFDIGAINFARAVAEYGFERPKLTKSDLRTLTDIWLRLGRSDRLALVQSYGQNPGALMDYIGRHADHLRLAIKEVSPSSKLSDKDLLQDNFAYVAQSAHLPKPDFDREWGTLRAFWSSLDLPARAAVLESYRSNPIEFVAEIRALHEKKRAEYVESINSLDTADLVEDDEDENQDQLNSIRTTFNMIKFESEHFARLLGLADDGEFVKALRHAAMEAFDRREPGVENYLGAGNLEESAGMFAEQLKPMLEEIAARTRCTFNDAKIAVFSRLENNVELPEKAPELYNDRRDEGETAPGFLRRVYRHYLETGALYQDDLRKRDPQLLKALRNYCQRNRIPTKGIVPPPRHERTAKLLGAPTGSAERQVARTRLLGRQRAANFRAKAIKPQ